VRRRHRKVYQLNATQLSDDGAAIPSYYTTHYFPERAVEQPSTLARTANCSAISPCLWKAQARSR